MYTTSIRFLATVVLLLVATTIHAQDQRTVRVASYNIKFLSTAVSSEGDRLQKLKQVIEQLDADVIGLQEIDNRAALNLVFPSASWTVVIDDESGDDQDVAVAVRKPFTVRNVDANLDADDQHFLFPASADNSLFPNRRDVLSIEVAVPENLGTFFVMVLHPKARVGGRATTDSRRVGAARKLLAKLQQDFEDKDFILLGDINDNPDDQSVNILETGNPNALGGAEEIDGPFLVNLMEPLVAAGHVSHGRTSGNIIGDLINTIDPESRRRNNDARGTDFDTGDILFDQILVPMSMKSRYVGGSASIFNNAIAVKGTNFTRASDHLPVFAEFTYGSEEPEEPLVPAGVRIAWVLPNPDGADAGREEVAIRNGTGGMLNLDGWKLRDNSSNTYNLSGTIPAGGMLVIVMTTNTMALNNNGDDVTLLDPSGAVKHSVTYLAADVSLGKIVEFE